ncbi:MAG: conserved phage C-terminal domain-containing protein [Prevotellaceae bacterium]|nr:conserved phage C-terminal domain-containing protein [Prevotellaceae bacterium]
MAIGWIALHRKILDNPLWEDKPFARGQAWIDLLLMVNHKDNQALFDGKIIEVKRGEKITSIRFLAERWGWSRTKVMSFLEVLEGAGMISFQSDTKKTAIKVLNYSKYQDFGDDGPNEKATEKPQKGHRNDTEMTQKNTNNNVKQYNNDQQEKIYIAGQARQSSSKNPDQASEKTANDVAQADEMVSDDEASKRTDDSAKVDEAAQKNRIPYREIIGYLNAKTGRAYKSSASKTREKIHARWAEGYRLDDFKRVVDVKAAQWQEDPRMSKYLRPETLFGRKFDGYVNEGLEAPKSAYQAQFERDLQATMEGWGQ